MFKLVVIILIMLLMIVGCGSRSNNRDIKEVELTAESENIEHLDEKIGDDTMKLYINGKEIPVTWEACEAVIELKKQAAVEDILVDMSMYSNNEQVGALGRSYTVNDKRTTTANGDIVLYNSSNIVVFYAPNTWSYTRLGKVNLSEEEVTSLLSNGDVQLMISMR